MATIQRSTTKVANRLISYAEKRAEVKEGVDCPAEYAKAQMKSTRELWGKNDGIQAHHIIQSFKPGEVTPELANELGQELAKEMAQGHEAVVYTHTDKDHIHNHIVINSVNFENGYKYHAHGTDELIKIREASDRICKEHDLSIVEENSSPVRYTLAEKALIDKNKFSWKDDIRNKIDLEKTSSKNYEEFKQNMMDKHGIEVKERGKNTTYINHENGKRVRGNKLGESYERETIKHEYTKSAEREIERKLGFDDYLFGKTIGTNSGENERNSGATTVRSEQLHSSSIGIGEGSEGKNAGHEKQQWIHGIIRPEVEGLANTSEHESDRASVRNNKRIEPTLGNIEKEHGKSIGTNEQESRKTNYQNETTSTRANRVRNNYEAGKQTNEKGITHGERTTDRGDRSPDINSMGNSDTSRVEGGDLFSNLVNNAQQNENNYDNDLEKQRQKAKKKSKNHTLEDELEL
ncbi:relaxase/mobilization nuclease domain-containing protein [Oceanobacillus sp. CF4.6]|uniref:relaxase/mobilization nuclease domain-containing protein n=1 Tax=Oceanobacillus sp. CF4.6 TaxID=3373080 RepID=UPI003EE5DB40